MNSKQRVIAVLEGKTPDCTPAGFSLHFPVEESAGQAGVESHGRFLRETHVDILKVMNENLVPDVGEVKTPADWQKVCDICRDDTFIRRQLDFAKRVLDSCADAQAFALGTLHGIVASGIHPYEASYGYDGARTLQVMHLRENPAPVLEAFKRITERMCQLARGYAEIGMDGVYYAALGGETCCFTDEEFDRWVRPFDQEILSEIRSSGRYAFLHICKHGLNMQRYHLADGTMLVGHAALTDTITDLIIDALGLQTLRGQDDYGRPCQPQRLHGRGGSGGTERRGRSPGEEVWPREIHPRRGLHASHRDSL